MGVTNNGLKMKWGIKMVAFNTVFPGEVVALTIMRNTSLFLVLDVIQGKNNVIRLDSMRPASIDSNTMVEVVGTIALKNTKPYTDIPIIK